MLIFPAIDIYEGKVVRLYKGEYARMTVYSDDPVAVARDFAEQGARYIHVVDLQGARYGETPNLKTIVDIKRSCGLFVQTGGGIRSEEVIARYIDSGIDRVILGTAAVTEPDFAACAVQRHGKSIAVGVDIRDGKVAVKGWTECAETDALDFCRKMQDVGVSTLICTDISRDGAMQGANHSLYSTLADTLNIDIIASGGVSSIEDVKSLAGLKLYGAIIGKAYYTGDVSLREAIEVAE